nr:ribonuclease H-like domain-containing protein [Tanacetum cinerariifolium]
MHQPPSFRDSTHPDYMCLLQRSLYGLKQASRAWFQLFASYITREFAMTDLGSFNYFLGIFVTRDSLGMFLSQKKYAVEILECAALSLWAQASLSRLVSAVCILYYQDLLHRIISSLHQEFAMTDLGSFNYFLGIFVTRDSLGMFLSQKKYAVEILECAGMVYCNPSRTPVDTES